MSKGKIHIVCLDAPSPPDYGGVYDLYYKVPALAKIGYEVILHYFDYREGRSADGLEPHCAAIFKYRRKAFWRSLFSSLPYIVYSRINHELIRRLNKDAAPIILEGIHCTGLLPYININGRKVIVRVHNDEGLYYKELATVEKNFLKKTYLQRESKLLLKHQSSLSSNLHYSFVAQTDRQQFKKKYGLTDTSFIPVFVPWTKINGKLGKETYCLYHGNLSVAENIQAVEWLLKNVFAFLNVPLIIAGKSPRRFLISLIKKYPNVQLVINPSEHLMAALIEDAQIHLLPSFNKTGVKLKLLHALLNGRFCVTNDEGINGSGIEKGVLIVDTAKDYTNIVASYMGKDFTSNDIEERRYLLALYNNETSAKKLSAFL